MHALPPHDAAMGLRMRASAVKAMFGALPLQDFASIFGDRPILVLAPHPDDESLGCGGMIAHACASGHPIYVAVLTDGAASHPGSVTWPPPRLRALRAAEARSATALLGLPQDHLLLLNAPDGSAPHQGAGFHDLAARLGDWAEARAVGTICASWRHDPHGDHVAAARLAAAVAARIGARHLAYPVWAWTLPDDADLPSPAAGARLDIAACLPLKRRAIDAHASQTTGLIADSPDGFRMSATFRAWFEQPWETFLDPD
jgi:LmbE family N-acetylglucosaminyl deacetylase